MPLKNSRVVMVARSLTTYDIKRGRWTHAGKIILGCASRHYQSRIRTPAMQQSPSNSQIPSVGGRYSGMIVTSFHSARSPESSSDFETTVERWRAQPRITHRTGLAAGLDG